MYIDFYIESTCPSTHPYAFGEGNSCCLFDKDSYNNQIYITSDTCMDNAYILCPGGTYCKNFAGMNNIIEL